MAAVDSRRALGADDRCRLAARAGAGSLSPKAVATWCQRTDSTPRRHGYRPYRTDRRANRSRDSRVTTSRDVVDGRRRDCPCVVIRDDDPPTNYQEVDAVFEGSAYVDIICPIIIKKWGRHTRRHIIDVCFPIGAIGEAIFGTIGIRSTL